MRWLVACPIRLSSSASLRMLLHVHRRGDSGLSFGLFRDPETPENRGFLVYLGLLGIRGSSGTARKQTESTKLGPRKSESLVRGGRLVAGDQQVRPPRCPVVDLLDQVLAGVTIPRARHEGQQQSALGIDGGVVPVVTTQPVQRVERIARLLLLSDEGPFLIELDLPGRGGNRPPVLGGGARHGRRPGRRNA